MTLFGKKWLYIEPRWFGITMLGNEQSSDVEYLRMLMERERICLPPEIREMKRQRCHEAVAEMVKKGLLDQDPVEGKEYRSAASYLQRLLDQSDPVKIFQNDNLQNLREKALTRLGNKRTHLEEVPVGIFSTQELNGFAIRTPRGGAAIALYDSLWLFLKIAYYCIFAIMFRKTPHAIGSHHSDEVYAVNLLQSVLALRDGAIIIMSMEGDYSIVDCVAEASRPEPIVVGQMLDTLLFILLHEYGHIWHGHLDTTKTRRKMIADEPTEVYTTSQMQEFEADLFAVSHMWNDNSKVMTDNYMVLFSATVLFNLFDLCEGNTDQRSLGTHPRSLDRLAKIYETCQKKCESHTWLLFESDLNNMQSLFEKLKRFGVAQGIL
jgi:hypothetical protein